MSDEQLRRPDFSLHGLTDEALWEIVSLMFGPDATVEVYVTTEGYLQPTGDGTFTVVEPGSYVLTDGTCTMVVTKELVLDLASASLN